MRRHLGLVLLLVSAFAVLTATPASASCIAPPGTLRQRLETAPHLFVGTVTRLGGGDRAAEVQVESTWRGDAEGTVQVAGGETDAGAASSVDRTYEMGRRYLFVPYDRSGGAFRDNVCTDTRPWRPRLERLRPEGAQPVTAGQPSEAPAPGTPNRSPRPQQPSAADRSSPTSLPQPSSRSAQAPSSAFAGARAAEPCGIRDIGVPNPARDGSGGGNDLGL